MEIKVIRSSRKTLAVQIKDGGIIVRAPYRTSEAEIRAFLIKHQQWIATHLAEAQKRKEKLDQIRPLSSEELNELGEQALRVIPERVRLYAPLVGVTYGKITIRNQKSRWGSCSLKGNLNFNCLLMLTPLEVIDSVVVHELCHRLEMNHSERFYREVLRVYPEYDEWNRWLKTHGAEIMAANRQ